MTKRAKDVVNEEESVIAPELRDELKQIAENRTVVTFHFGASKVRGTLDYFCEGFLQVTAEDGRSFFNIPPHALTAIEVQKND